MLLDPEEAPIQWHVGEPRRFQLIAVNDGQKSLMLPAISDLRGEAIFSSGGETLISDRKDPHEFLEGPGGSPPVFPAAAEFVEIVPHASVGLYVTLKPVAPGSFRLGAVLQTECTQRESMVAVVVAEGVARASRQRTPVAGAWTGLLEREASFEVTAEPSPGWGAKRRQLERLFDDPRATDEKRIADFESLVADNDWHSWTVCRDALDRPKWRGVHGVARDRLLALFEWGMPGVEWPDFLERLEENPRWRELRPAAVPLIATVARGFILQGSQPGSVTYWPSDKTARQARELLESWAKGAGGEVAAKARAALAELSPIPASSPERAIAGHPPGTPTPAPIPFPEGKLDGKAVISIPWQMYYLAAKSSKELRKEAPAVTVEIHGRGKENVWGQFDRKEVDVVALGHKAHDLDRLLQDQYPNPTPWPSSYWMGDSVACVVVHPRNPLAEIEFTTLRQIFFAIDAPGWDIAGGKAVEIKRYGETGGHTGDIVRRLVGGGSSYENKGFEDLETPENLLARVAADPHAIGFVRFGSEVIDAAGKVKILAIKATAQDKAVLPSMATVSNDTYPLRERLTLLMHPEASPAAAALCAIAGRLTWKEIGATSGFWPTSEIRTWRMEQRLEQAKAGKGLKVSGLGPPTGKRLIEGLCLELTRSEVAVRGQYTAVNDSEALSRFGARAADLLVTDGPLSAEILAGLAKASPDLDVRSAPIGRETVALVIHPAHKLESLTVDQARDVLTGTIRDWWSGPPGGTGIKRIGPPSRDDALTLLAAKLDVPPHALKLEHRRTTAEVIKAVAADPRAIGVLSFAELPADESGVVVVPVVVPGVAAAPARTLGPTANEYPFAREWYLSVHGRAAPAARLLVDRLSSGALPDAAAACGLMPISQTPEGE